MSVDMQFEVATSPKLNRKHTSTLASTSTSEEHSLMEDKLASLQSQYVQMENEYSKKIKELKNILADKCKRQALLIGQISNLREDFKNHQEQIAQVGEKISQQNKEESLKITKKNSSPGLIKKSIQVDKKYEKKQSPTNHVVNSSNKYGLKLFGQVKKTQTNQNSSPALKRRSPRANPNGILHILKQEPLTHVPLHQKQILGNLAHSGKKYIQPTSGDKKKAYSPKNSQEVRPLNVASAKNLKKVQPQANPVSNPSPKRPIRRSPGFKAVPKIEPTKESKRLLGNLKQTTAEIQQVF